MRRFKWESGEDLDPSVYIEWLVQRGDELPPGALAYVSHPNHFDYYAFRVGDEPLEPGTPLCPKDLLLHEVIWSGGRDCVELRLMFPGYDPETIGGFDLTIVYRNVLRFHLDHHRDAPRRVPVQLGGLMSDEVTPAGLGVVHYLDFECGSVVVVGDDLTATWR
jgi:hypothetical protein